MITAEQLREWQATCDKATPGPWVVGVTWDGRYGWPVLRLKEMEGCSEDALLAEEARNAEFVMIARVAMPALLDEFARRGLGEEDGVVCPRCGEMFHDTDINANPDEYWRCPYCFTWQHTRCRGPIDDDTEAAAIVREIERLRALLREWDAKCQGHCDTESIAEQVEVLG